jgi:hypothetical protein
MSLAGTVLDEILRCAQDDVRKKSFWLLSSFAYPNIFHCTTTVTIVAAVSAPDVAVMVMRYVPAGVPLTGGGVEPPPPPHPATKHSTASIASGRRVRRRRGDAALAGMTNQIASITNSASSGEPSGANVIFVARSRANSGAMSDDVEDEEAIGGKDTAAERTAPAVRAVVVTVNVVPLMVQVPSGIEQLAVSVGGAVNPLVVIGKVNAVPADPIWVGCDGVTIGARRRYGNREQRTHVHVAGFSPIKPRVRDENFEAGDDQGQERQSGEPVREANQQSVPRSNHFRHSRRHSRKCTSAIRSAHGLSRNRD